MSKLRLINIKLSAHFAPKISDSDFLNIQNVLCDEVGPGKMNIRIQSYNYTIMGREKSHLNVTGVKSFGEISKAISIFLGTFKKVVSISNLKIDSIFFCYKFEEKELLKCIIEDLFGVFNCVLIVKKYHNFKGRVNLKLKKN